MKTTSARIPAVSRRFDSVGFSEIVQVRNRVLELLAAEPEVSGRLTADELKACFDPAWYLRHVDAIFKRIGLL